jgi:hypothetical protein
MEAIWAALMASRIMASIGSFGETGPIAGRAVF